MSKVTSINGDALYTGEPNDRAIEVLEETLERARSGDVIGVCIVNRNSDGTAGFFIGGSIGGYSMLGSLEVVRSHLVDVNRSDD